MPSNKQRREAARRKLERQLEARQERARRRRRGNLIASVVGALVVVGVVIAFIAINSGSDKNSDTAASASATDSAAPTSSAAPVAAANAYPCKFTKSGTAAKKNTAPTNLKPAKTGTVAVAVKTTQGDMTFTLDRASAPCAVESFDSLVTQKYYDNTKCHRLVTDGIFVLQCGDPTATGSGGPGYTVNDEYTGKEAYSAGVIAMANTGAANSTGGQFFIVYKDSSAALGKTYTIVGKVTTGLDVVTKVAAGGTVATSSSTTDGAPKIPITITSMTAAKA